MKYFSIKKIREKFKETFKRFPISFILSFIVFGIYSFMVFKNYSYNSDIQNLLYKINTSFILSYFLSIGIYLFSENFQFNKIKKSLFQLFTPFFGILFYFFLSKNAFNDFILKDFILIILTFLSILSFIFISPFIKKIIDKNINNKEYYIYFNELFSKIGMAIIAGISILILGFIALFTVFELFEIFTNSNQGKIFELWWIFSMTLFAPIYFLSIFPQNDDENLEKINIFKENKFYSFLVNYISLPFIILYFLILYTYTVKVLMNFEQWPKGEVSWMVIGFSLFGYLIYSFSFIFEGEKNIIKIFRKIFPFAVIFQVPMLFYAIYLRINQYDFTINRYLIVAFGLYLIAISLYFIFSKSKNLIAIFSTLLFFSLLISFGPWSIYSFPKERQLILLKEKLIEAKIFQNGEIILPKEKIEKKLSGEIYDKIDYLCETSGCKSMENLLGSVFEEIENEEKFKNREYKYREFQDKIAEKLKVSQAHFLDKNINGYEYIEIIKKYSNNIYFLEVKNYDYLINIINKNDIEIDILTKGEYIKYSLFLSEYDNEKMEIIIYKGKIRKKNIVEIYNIEKEINEFYKKNKDKIGQRGNIEIENLFIIKKEGKVLDVKIIFKNLKIKNPEYKGENGKNNYFYTNGDVLIREK